MPISKVKIGDVFGDLTIIADSGKRGKDGSIIWRCKCSCGNENYETVSAELRRAPPRNKTHCNNSIHSIKDVSGQVFGDVEVLSFSRLHSRKSYFNCKCLRCGKLFEARGNDLLMGKTQTCGCGKGYSKGAIKIKALLEDSELIYGTEISFSSCVTEKGNPMYFDFGVYADSDRTKLLYLIEYDGEQHFYYGNGVSTWNTKEQYERTQLRDALKNSWCKNNNIPLIRIPYTRFSDLTIADLLLETSNYKIN